MDADDEHKRLRSAALLNAQSILEARQRAEQELLETKEALEGEMRSLELLNQTATKLSAKLDVQSVVQALTDAGLQLSGAQFGAFFSANSDSFELFVVSGAPREWFQVLAVGEAIAIFAPTFRGKVVVRKDDIHEDPRWRTVNGGAAESQLPFRSYLAVPVVGAGEVLGGLVFGHALPAIFTQRSERRIVGLAAHASVAIDNARLYEEAKGSADERARLLDAERLARAEVERVSTMKDEFLATLSHELRTPLNAIVGWSEVLLTQPATDPPTRRGLEAIARNALSQAQLIDDLLDMNLLVSGRIRLVVQRVDLAATLDSAIESVRPSVEAKAIVVQRTMDPNAGPVLGDPSRLQQIAWNLLTNAVKFTAKGGTVHVVLRRVNSHVEMTIHDSGIGISADFLPHVFERFRQADSSTTRRYGGLGLGLSIVKQLVELHGGTVRVESDGEGKGSSFTVALPLRAVRDADDPSGASASAEGGRAAEVSLDGITVLVVDDDEDARDLIKAVLVAASARVVTARSADEGFAAAKSNLPDVIVSDIGMPDRDGYQFIRDVRALEPGVGGKTPAIALTAFARSQDRTRAMLAGYQVHVSKPIDPNELIATVKSLAGNRGGR